MMLTAPRVIVDLGHVKLDAQLHVKERADSVGLLIIHPYPLLGGSMLDPVVSEVFRHAVASPAFACVMRYNQRGVGLSSGSKSLRGKADGEDVETLCGFLLSKLTGSNKRVFVVGYSWGACLATHALSCPRMTAYVGISFPLGGLAVVLQPRKHFAALCAATHVPRLLIIGTQDQYAKQKTLLQLVQQHGGAAYDAWEAQPQEQPPPLQQDEQRPSSAAGHLLGGQPSGDIGGSPASQRAGGGSEPLQQPLPPSQQQQDSSAVVQQAEHGFAAQGTFGMAPLLLKTYPGADHFWLDDVSHMAEEVVQWLEGVAQSQAA